MGKRPIDRSTDRPIGRSNKNLRVYTVSDANWLSPIHNDSLLSTSLKYSLHFRLIYIHVGDLFDFLWTIGLLGQSSGIIMEKHLCNYSPNSARSNKLSPFRSVRLPLHQVPQWVSMNTRYRYEKCPSKFSNVIYMYLYYMYVNDIRLEYHTNIT